MLHRLATGDPSPACGGRCRQAEGGSNKLYARSNLTDLSPRILNVRHCSSSRAPKRDHDEWLVRWMVGWSGSRAGSGPKYRGMGRFADQAAINARGARCGVLQRGKAAHIRGRERWAMPGRPGCQAAHAFRDAARDAPEPGYHKPKTPIGWRGESLICLRTDRCGDQTSPAPLTPSSTRGGNAGGRFRTSNGTQSHPR